LTSLDRWNRKKILPNR